jgi:hypothetical protein
MHKQFDEEREYPLAWTLPIKWSNAELAERERIKNDNSKKA